MPTLEEALRTYLQIERRELTNRQYAHVLGHLVGAVGPRRAVELISYEDLVDYLARRRAEGLKPLTLAGYTSVIKAFFNWCARRRYIDHSPAADIKRRKSRRDPDRALAVPADELNRMVEYARLTSARNHALLLFLIDTGCRVGGLLSLTLDRLSVETGEALLDEKGGVLHRVFFGEETAQALAAWLKKRPAAGHRYVWTGLAPAYKPLSRTGVAAILRVLSFKTGASRPWNPHAIRHAVADAYRDSGIPPTVTQRKLGHFNIDTTMRHYQEGSDEYAERVIRRTPLLALRRLTPSEGAPPLRLVPKRGAR